MIIPPSIPILMFAMVGIISAGNLFMCGVIHGLLRQSHAPELAVSPVCGGSLRSFCMATVTRPRNH